MKDKFLLTGLFSIAVIGLIIYHLNNSTYAYDDEYDYTLFIAITITSLKTISKYI